MKREQEILEAAHKSEYPENVPYFVNGAKWADETMLKKAQEYLKRRCSDAVTDRYFIEDFCAAMKG